MTKIAALLMLLALCGCATSGYKKFYRPDCDISQLKDVEFLAENEEPHVVQVDPREVKTAIKSFLAKGYQRIGYSDFNGGYEDLSNVKAQAKRLKAVAALVWWKYTDTQTATVPLYMPTSQTTYETGTITAGNTYGTYNGSSTTYGSTVVPVTTQQRRFDQSAVFFVKSTWKYRFGVQVADLTPDMRTSLGRNTGAVVDTVIEKTPAFYANILEGDVIVAVDENAVRDKEEATKAMLSVPPQAKSSVLTILRKGAEMKIEVKF